MICAARARLCPPLNREDSVFCFGCEKFGGALAHCRYWKSLLRRRVRREYRSEGKIQQSVHMGLSTSDRRDNGGAGEPFPPREQPCRVPGTGASQKRMERPNSARGRPGYEPPFFKCKMR